MRLSPLLRIKYLQFSLHLKMNFYTTGITSKYNLMP